MNQRKIIIFGATGSVGKLATKQALAAGYQVTAFTRSRAKAGLEHPNLAVVEGDILDTEHVNKAVENHDAVLCTLGAGRHGYIREAGTRNIVTAMRKHGVDRLICQSTWGAGDSYEDLSFFWKRIMFGMLIKPVLVDHNKQEREVRNSGLNWTIVRPAAFNNGPLTKSYRHEQLVGSADLTFKISRSDVAHFMLEQIDSDTYHRQAVGLSY